jgi:hypothetical protein
MRVVSRCLGCALYACSVLFLGSHLSCKKGVDPPDVAVRIQLTVIDAGVRETYIHLSIQHPTGSESVAVYRNGALVLTFAASQQDTIVVDTGLTQNATYEYRAILYAGGEVTGGSNGVQTQTLAPTSHAFTWETFLLGDGNGSSLYDVAIVRADPGSVLVYAVGELYLTGEPTRYNVAVWNGNNWELMRIQFNTICGQSGTTPYPASSIFAFGPTDMWISSQGGQLARWDGTTQTAAICMPEPFAVSKIWGEANSIYAVGYGGRIAHYTSGTWRRIESGTTTHILDAHGVLNPVTGKTEVYCAVTDFWQPQDRKVLRIRDTVVDSIPWTTGRNLSSLWTHNGFPLFTTGDGIFENSAGHWREINLGTSVYTNRIRGTGLNDITLCGSFGLLAHYNGIDWRTYPEVYNAIYSGLAVSDDLVVAVGERNGRGVVTIGRRQ